MNPCHPSLFITRKIGYFMVAYTSTSYNKIVYIVKYAMCDIKVT